MKYKGYELKKVYDNDVIGGYYYDIYKNEKFITTAYTLNNAKEFINSGENWNVLC